ncbi:hypothetical protein VNO77_22743 [Canavalia gladiata]|uniref:Uncharacterized protein n=1 Tax=Canavalia gladiata TaxID=3824 RepID=A0AAN9L6L1_CANGL
MPTSSLLNPLFSSPTPSAIPEPNPLPTPFISGSSVKSRSMIFEPVMKDGVFQFGCFVNNKDASYPSISFVNRMNRDFLIITHKVPSYTLAFECLLE